MKPVTFLEALQFARSRKIVLPDEFYSLDLKTRQLATTVSFLSSIEQIQTVIAAVNKAIADGSTFEDFKKVVAENEIKLSEPYLKNVFRTNIQTAYSHGRWQQQQRNRDKRPYLMYSAIDDSRVRPSHLALNRIIRHIDDPFWLMYYPPWSFMCRCTVIALTEKQAEKYGITPDDQLPEVAEEMGWSTSPMTYGDLSGLVDQKILDSDLDKAFLLEQKEVIKAEWMASKKLASLFAPMDDKTRDLFDVVANTVIPLDPDIRPSAIRTFLDYVQGNDSALTAQLKQPPITLAEEVLKRWLKEDLSRLQAVASNSATTVAGSASLTYAASLEVGKVITLDAPLLLAGSGSNIVIQIENAKGLGIDLEKLNAGQGVLFPLGISFQVVSRGIVNRQIVYSLKILEN
ncbi:MULTISPECIES: phage head morphogenesis protein [Acinetobacter]|jgi:SPP1 gp7 family putative phage head morphogenesis protein|uniref:phage head morphogenesis protein n=1 Tax=Acinetobacter TaxID=469 RepID=UPI000446437C|nr:MULTISPECIES: phage minor head protein [Acinetobacter]EXF55845.1 phage head morphogenesis, SPP1 gp7 family domain protein [Acinetobacter sp. 1294596]MCK4094354.1 minor capsid protein [Acinetobacter radioresistens]MCX0347120.1 phage minor head protein [Acinetobacter radioresistens]